MVVVVVGGVRRGEWEGGEEREVVSCRVVLVASLKLILSGPQLRKL